MMTKKSGSLLLKAALGVMAVSALAAPANASITGTLAFGPNGAYGGQYWSPNVVNNPGTFYYFDYANTDTAAFNGDTLTVTDIVSLNANGWEMTFTQPGGFGGLTLNTTNFAPGLTYSLTGGKIVLDWIGTFTGGVTYTAVFNAPATKVSEPTTLTLVGLALLGAGLFVHRRRKI
jgi:LPXTG-motif cell wall-anchored protein